MTPGDAFIELLDRVAASREASALLNADELGQWPEEAVTAMKAQKLIIMARPASSLACPGCEEACAMPVHTISTPSGEPAPFIVCSKRDDIGCVPVPVAHLERWRTSGDAIAGLLADLLGLRRSNAGGSSVGRWEVGMFRGTKHAGHLVLLAREKLALTLAGHSIALAEVLALEGGGFKVDKRRLTRLVDRPVAGAGDVESAEQKRERIKRRVNKLKAQGERAFLKTVAEEEGLSTSRIKQLLHDDNSAPESKKSYW